MSVGTRPRTYFWMYVLLCGGGRGACVRPYEYVTISGSLALRSAVIERISETSSYGRSSKDGIIVITADDRGQNFRIVYVPVLVVTAA